MMPRTKTPLYVIIVSINNISTRINKLVVLKRPRRVMNDCLIVDFVSLNLTAITENVFNLQQRLCIVLAQ